MASPNRTNPGQSGAPVLSAKQQRDQRRERRERKAAEETGINDEEGDEDRTKSVDSREGVELYFDGVQRNQVKKVPAY